MADISVGLLTRPKPLAEDDHFFLMATTMRNLFDVREELLSRAWEGFQVRPLVQATLEVEVQQATDASWKHVRHVDLSPVIR